MKIAIVTMLAGAALALAACGSKPAETTNNVIENGTDLNAADSEGFDNGESLNEAGLENGADAANVN